MSEDRRIDDELISAVVDGEASTEDVARVHADPQLEARLAQFEHVASLVAAPLSANAAAERAIDAALGAFDDAERARSGQSAVTDLATRRTRRPPTVWLAVAAALVLVALAVPILLAVSNDVGDEVAGRGEALVADDTASEMSTEAFDSAGGSPDAAFDDEALREADGDDALPAPGTTVFGSAPLDLGSFGVLATDLTDDELARLAASALDVAEGLEGPVAAEPSFPETADVLEDRSFADPTIPQRCGLQLRPDVRVVGTGTARVDGVDASVLVFADEVLVVTSDCMVVLDAALQR